MGRYKRSRQDAFHPAGRPAQVAGASIPAAAFVRAYEGELRRSSPPAPRLIRWAGADDVWADSHDILHLIDSLPRLPPSPSLSSCSEASDIEERFALSGDEEHAEHAAARHKKFVESVREQRIREREREDEEAEKGREREKERVLNEPPTPEILKLMEHTARALARSPNAAALESRILTRQGGDARFAFMRAGAPSSAVWARVRARALEEVGGVAGAASTSSAPIAVTGGTGPGPGPGSRSAGSGSMSASGTAAPASGVGLLGGYGSDSGSESEAEAPPREPSGSPPPPPPESPPPSPPATTESARATRTAI